VEALADAIENSCRLQHGLKLQVGSEGMRTPTGKQFSRSEWWNHAFYLLKRNSAGWI